MGLAENVAGNYTSALDAFDHALEIMTAIHDRSSRSNLFLAEGYVGKGETYAYLGKYESAVACFEEALKIERKLFNENTEKIAEVLYLLGTSQWCFDDLSSALPTLQRALQISIKLYAENPSSNRYIIVVNCYTFLGKLHCELGNNTESINCFKAALKVSSDCDRERSLAQSFLCVELLNFHVDENLYMELLDSSLAVIKENYKSFLPVLYLALGSKQLESGKYETGLASLEEALDIELEVTLRENVATRERTVFCYMEILVKIGKSKLARRAIDRAIKIAESLPELGTQHLWLFRCYTCKGRIQYEMRDYIPAIESLEHALLQLPKIAQSAYDKIEEFKCRKAIAAAYFFDESYQDSLSSMYDALSIIKDHFPEGSKVEAGLYFSMAEIARKMENKILKVNNLRLAYKMFSKILGKKHSKTEQCYIAYVRALIA